MTTPYHQLSKELDLHGVKHQDVFRTVDQFVGRHILAGSYEIKIITGYSQRMKDLVQNVLDDYDLKAEEGIINKGMLTIKL